MEAEQKSETPTSDPKVAPPDFPAGAADPELLAKLTDLPPMSEPNPGPLLRRLFHQLTCYVPRKMPTSSAGMGRLMTIMLEDFGLPDQEKVCLCIMNYIGSKHPDSIRIQYGKIANRCKRLYINEAANKFRGIALKSLHERLEKNIAHVAKEAQGDDKKEKAEQSGSDARPEPPPDQVRKPA